MNQNRGEIAEWRDLPNDREEKGDESKLLT